MTENNGVDYRDSTPLSQADIDNINHLITKGDYEAVGQHISDWLKHKKMGKAVRSALSLWSENTGLILNKTKTVADNATDLSIQTKKDLEKGMGALTSDSEVVTARGDYPLLGDRLLAFNDSIDNNNLSTKSLSNFTQMKELEIGRTANLNDQKFKISDTPINSPNNYSTFKLDNGKFAYRYFDHYNDWLKGLGGKQYAAHKGYTGYSENVAMNGIYPGNTIKSIEKALQMGFSVIETDTRCTANGDWVIIHDENTSNLDSGSSDELISKVQTNDLLKRSIKREYITGGYYWDYTGEETGYNVPLVSEILSLIRKYGAYVLLEIKPYEATTEQLKKLADTIHTSGAEDHVILFGSMNTLVQQVAKDAPNVIVGFMDTDYTQGIINTIKSYPNHFATISKDKIAQAAPILNANNIPWGVWTIDDYQEAENNFNQGAQIVTTCRLISNLSQAGYNRLEYFNLEDFGKPIVTGSPALNWRENGTGGTTTFDETTKEVSLKSSGTYYSRTLLIDKSRLPNGSLIHIKITAKTKTYTSNNYGRVYVTGKNSKGKVIEDVIQFPNNYYETKELYFPITDDLTGIITTSIGLAGQGIVGTSEMMIRDLETTVLVPKYNRISKISEWSSQGIGTKNSVIWANEPGQYRYTALDSAFRNVQIRCVVKNVKAAQDIIFVPKYLAPDSEEVKTIPVGNGGITANISFSPTGIIKVLGLSNGNFDDHELEYAVNLDYITTNN